MQAQLLDLFNSEPTFNNFIPLSNEIVYTSLQQGINQFTHICGSELSGKTHLLKAWANLAISKGQPAIYIDSKTLNTTVNLTSLISTRSFIAIDNIDYLNETNQIALFDLFNALKLGNLDNFLLTSSRTTLDQLATIREDLKTRLLSGLNLTLKALDDDNLFEVLKIYINQEGIKINQAELYYLINHYTRNTGLLINKIHKIANAALLEKRSITIPLIRQVMEGNS